MESWPWAVPEPARGMISVGVEASELMEILLLALPADRGAKVTLKVTL